MNSLPCDTSLLVVDVQLGFDESRWGKRNNPEAEQRIADLLAAFRSGHRRVAHMRHISPLPTGAFTRGGKGMLPKPVAIERADEPVYFKSVNSSFIGTTLERDLRADGVNTLVIVGLTTNHCISTTARMSGNLGFRTLVVSDATATFDRRGLDGKMRPADQVHAGALSDIQEEFAEIVDTATLLEAMTGSTKATGLQNDLACA